MRSNWIVRSQEGTVRQRVGARNGKNVPQMQKNLANTQNAMRIHLYVLRRIMQQYNLYFKDHAVPCFESVDEINVRVKYETLKKSSKKW